MTTNTTPRFPVLTLDTVTAEQRPLAEQIVKVSSIGLGGPYSPLLRSPELGQRMFDLLAYLRWKTTLPLNLNEFAILIVGRQWRSQVEWFAHVPIAIKAGLGADLIAELKTNTRPSNMKPDEAITYDFVTELTTTHVVSDATFARAKGLFTEQQIVDLTTVAGTYITIAMLISMANMQIPAGGELPFKPGEV
jgi:4-carboxymuconolactone decarboxylase